MRMHFQLCDNKTVWSSFKQTAEWKYFSVAQPYAFANGVLQIVKKKWIEKI